MTLFLVSGLVALFCAWVLIFNGLVWTAILIAGLIGLTSGILTARSERGGD